MDGGKAGGVSIERFVGGWSNVFGEWGAEREEGGGE